MSSEPSDFHSLTSIMQNIYSHLTLWYLHSLSRDCIRSDLMTMQAHSILLLYKQTSDVLGNFVWEKTLAVPLPRALNQHARAQSSFPASQAGHTEPGSLVQSTLQWCWCVGQVTVSTKWVLWKAVCLWLCFVSLATMHGLWDLSFPTKDWIQAHGSESTES